MKRWAWRAAYVGLFYLGFTVALNTALELQERAG